MGGRILLQEIFMKLRIETLLLLLFAAPVLAGCVSPFDTRPPAQTDRPNIIIIMTDDQPVHSIEQMPSVQKELVENGITFENAYVTTPLCCPSRASILTGQYVHNHGVKTNRIPIGGATVFDDVSTLAVWLDEAGYHNGLIGKYLNDYDALPEGYVPPGWDDFHAFVKKDPDKDFYFGYSMNENGKIVQYGFEQEDYSTDVICDKAVDFIRTNRDKPFFLMVNFYAPHQPYLAAERHKDLFKEYDENFTRYAPPNYYEEDLSDKPEWMQIGERPDKDYVEKVRQRMLRTLAGVDDSVGELVALLEEEGIRDNTLIIFMSDNGYALGDHGLIGKACPYEECLRIPLVILYPDKITASRLDPSMVLNIDIAPTVMDLVGSPSPSTVDGLSFLPMLDAPQTDWRDGFLIEQFQDDGEDRSRTSYVPPYVGFLTREWKYIEYENGERELYDLINDPYEMENLASLAKYESVMQELAVRMREIRP